jgi:alkylation response protein AidB-like acyl-CoA dehydrogenase
MSAHHVAGVLPASHPLSVRALPQRLHPLIRALFGASPADPWSIDTRRLPVSLQRLRHAARDFAQQQMAPLAAQIDATAHWPAGQHPAALDELLVRAGRAGWLTDLLPWPLGSMPLSRVQHALHWQACIKVEEFSRACGGLSLMLSGHTLGIGPLVVGGDLGIVRRHVLPAYRQTLRGQPHLFAFAITEPGAGSDVEDGHGAASARPGVKARRVPGGWLLNGRKCYITGADMASTITLFAALEGEGIESWTCFVVPRSSAGFEVVRNEDKMGMRAAGSTELALHDVFVADAQVVGPLRSGWALSRQTLTTSRLPVAAMGIGLAQAACDIALDFACHMHMGGQPLIHQQDVQMTLAQMLTETSSLRGQLWHCAQAWAPRQGVASMNKLHATDTAMRVVTLGMDLLGNHALLHMNRMEKVYRDARVTQIFEGTNQINRLAVIEDMQEDLLARMAAGRR